MRRPVHVSWPAATELRPDKSCLKQAASSPLPSLSHLRVFSQTVIFETIFSEPVFSETVFSDSLFFKKVFCKTNSASSPLPLAFVTLEWPWHCLRFNWITRFFPDTQLHPRGHLVTPIATH